MVLFSKGIIVFVLTLAVCVKEIVPGLLARLRSLVHLRLAVHLGFLIFQGSPTLLNEMWKSSSDFGACVLQVKNHAAGSWAQILTSALI
jgi:hypothetical protein